MSASPQSLIPQLTSQIEEGLSKLTHLSRPIPQFPELEKEIEEAHQWPLMAGGKRVRPLLTLLAAGCVGGDRGVAWALPGALALELVHTYSLVHDDLPSMDNDSLRRGKPTTHVKWGEAKGLLVGDGLLTEAFALLSSMPVPEPLGAPWHTSVHMQVQVLSQAAGPNGMVGGQWLDISSEKNPSLRWDQVENIHARKTGALLGAALGMGVVAGWHSRMGNELPPALMHATQRAGEALGVAFQVIDDILDLTQSSEALGKTAGKDVAQSKATSVTTLGLHKAQQEARLHTEKAFAFFHSLEDFCLTEVQYSPWRLALESLFQELLIRTH